MKSSEITEDLWSMLPFDLIETIADRLLIHAIDDYIRFRAICTSWRSATRDPRRRHIPPQVPWLMLSFDEARTNDRSFFRLSDGKVFNFHLPEARNTRILGSSNGWLVLVHESPTICLFNPLTRVQIVLPSLTTMPYVILEYREDDFGEEYSIYTHARPEGFFLADAEYIRDVFVEKVVTFPEVRSPRGDGMLVAMIHRNDLYITTVGGDKWTWSAQGCDCIDITYYQGQLYVVDYWGKITVVDIGALRKKVPPIIPAIIDDDEVGSWRYYLVEVDGNLLLVGRHYEDYQFIITTDRFEIFRVDNLSTVESKLTKLDSLGDWSLFLGTDRSISFNVKNYPGLKRNCIYFTASRVFHVGGLDEFTWYLGDDLGEFNLEDGSVEPLANYIDRSQFIWPPPIWFMADTSQPGYRHGI